jgi:hypothetical protein
MVWEQPWNPNNPNNQIDASLQPQLTADQVYTRNPQGRQMPLDGRTLSVNGDLIINGSGGQNYQDVNYVGGSGNLAQLQRENYYLKTRMQQEDALIQRENQLIQQLEARLQGGNNGVGWGSNQGQAWNPNYPDNQNYLNPNQNYLNPNQPQYVYDRYGHLVPSYQGMNQNQLVQDQYGRWVSPYQASLEQQQSGAGVGLNWGNLGQIQLQVGGNYRNPGYYQNPNSQYMAGIQGQNNANYLWQMEQARQQAQIANTYALYNSGANQGYNYASVNPSNYYGSPNPNYGYGYAPLLSIGGRGWRVTV